MTGLLAITPNLCSRRVSAKLVPNRAPQPRVRPAGKDKCPVPRKSPARSPTQGLTRLPRGQQSHLFDKSEGGPGPQDPRLDPTPVTPAPSPSPAQAPQSAFLSGPAHSRPPGYTALDPDAPSASAPPPPPRALGSPSSPPPRRGSDKASTPPSPADAGPRAGGRGRGRGRGRAGGGGAWAVNARGGDEDVPGASPRSCRETESCPRCLQLSARRRYVGSVGTILLRSHLSAIKW